MSARGFEDEIPSDSRAGHEFGAGSAFVLHSQSRFGAGTPLRVAKVSSFDESSGVVQCSVWGFPTKTDFTLVEETVTFTLGDRDVHCEDYPHFEGCPEIRDDVLNMESKPTEVFRVKPQLPCKQISSFIEPDGNGCDGLMRSTFEQPGWAAIDRYRKSGSIRVTDPPLFAAWSCDACGISSDTATERLHCAPCDRDLCGACVKSHLLLGGARAVDS